MLAEASCSASVDAPRVTLTPHDGGAFGRVSRRSHLICVGESFTDLIFAGLDRVPRPGEELRTRRFVATVGGGAVITAVAASRLGLRTTVISALGPDAVTRLRKEGVGVVNLLERGESPAVSVAISTRSDRSFVTFDGVNDRLERRLSGRWRRTRELSAPSDLRNFRFVHFAFAPRNCSHWARIVERLRAMGFVTSWDFGWHEDLVDRRGFQALAASVDYLFLNEQEAAMYARSRTLRSAIAVWRRDRPRPTIIKLGASGSRWIAPDRDLRVPVRARTPVDTTGAGDAFNGAFLAGLARGLSARRCLQLANRVGAASTTKPGGLDGLPRGRRGRSR